MKLTLMSLWHWRHWDSGVIRILTSMGHWCHCNTGDTVILMTLCHCGNTDITATLISLRHWCCCDTDVTQRRALGSCLCRVLLKPVCMCSVSCYRLLVQLLEVPCAAARLDVPQCQPHLFLLIPNGSGGQTHHTLDGCYGIKTDLVFK